MFNFSKLFKLWNKLMPTFVRCRWNSSPMHSNNHRGRYSRSQCDAMNLWMFDREGTLYSVLATVQPCLYINLPTLKWTVQIRRNLYFSLVLQYGGSQDVWGSVNFMMGGREPGGGGGGKLTNFGGLLGYIHTGAGSPPPVTLLQV